MAQDNVEVVRQLIAALSDRDVERYLALCTPEVEIGNPGAPLEGPTRGPEGVQEYFARVAEATTTFRVEAERIDTVDGDRVVLFGELKVVTSGGMAFDQPITNVYELAAGKLRRVDVYFDRAEALEAAGLRE